MQVQVYSKCKSTFSLSQLRLVPKVGQMGSTKFEGGLLQKCLQVKVHKTTPNQGLELLTKIYNCYNVYTIYKDTTRY
jgi:hypothetical protein